MNYTKSLFISASMAVLCLLISCQKESDTTDTTEVSTDSSPNIVSHEEATDYTWDTANTTSIDLNTSSITVTGQGATASGTTVTITAAGTYNINGSLTNGQIVVNANDDAVVKLIFNSISVSNSSSAPVFIQKSKKTIIILPDNSTSTLSDATTYTYATADEDEPNATIFSKSNATIYGNGKLNITSNFNDAIGSKDGLLIKNATISLTSVDDGIRGKDYLIVNNANITANVKGDGLKSDNEDDAGAGYISILDGVFKITSTGDAISAKNNVTITKGTFTLIAGGGSSAQLATDASAKGIKGINGVTIDGGEFTLNTADDGIHSNKLVVINGGTYTIASGDDGIHSDAELTINDGTITISKSVEGIEGGIITVNKGTLDVTSSDDGFNSSYGNGAENNDGSSLNLKGGTIYVNASGGDGLDSNGNINISGGTIIVHGPQSQPEVGLDYNGTCNVTGGFLVVSGSSSNMTQAPSTSSSQYSVKIMFTTSIAANSIFHLQDSEGNELANFKPKRSYSSIIFSSPNLKSGATYAIYTGGSATGTETNGYITGGTYSPGTHYASFTTSSIVTSLGSATSGGGGGGRP